MSSLEKDPVAVSAAKDSAPKAQPVKTTAKPAAKALPKAKSKAAPNAPAKVQKAVPAAGVAKVAKPAKNLKPAKEAKEKKVKLVRDSYTFPKPEFEVLAILKLRAAKLATPVKKTELVRAGIKALAGLPDAAFIAAVKSVPNLKTGRPAKAV